MLYLSKKVYSCVPNKQVVLINDGRDVEGGGGGGGGQFFLKNKQGMMLTRDNRVYS